MAEQSVKAIKLPKGALVNLCTVILSAFFDTHYQMSQCTTIPTKWHVHLAKTQISLAIHLIWSESLLSTWRKLGSLATQWAQAKTDQTADAQADLSLPCTHMPFCLFCHELAQIRCRVKSYQVRKFHRGNYNMGKKLVPDLGLHYLHSTTSLYMHYQELVKISEVWLGVNNKGKYSTHSI